MIFIDCFLQRPSSQPLKSLFKGRVTIITNRQNVEGIKKIKAGNRLLKGMDLTADELKILHNAAYFEDAAKIEKIVGAKISYVKLKNLQGRLVNNTFQNMAISHLKNKQII